MDEIHLNVPLLRRRVPNLTVAARAVGLRSATVSDLTTGKIPLGKATVRTLVALADLAGCTLDELVIRGGAVEMIETGIKVLDTFAPLVRGGTVGFVARQGSGQTVVLQELVRRLRQKGFATIAWLPTEAHPLMKEVAGEAEAVAVSLSEVQGQAAAFLTQRDVLVAADRAVVLSGELEALRERLQSGGLHRVTFALVDVQGESPDEDAPFGPLDTLWKFDVELAARRIFPAVDPVQATSTLLEGAQLDPGHLLVQQRARKLFRRYQELKGLARAVGVEKIPAAELRTYHRGERLELFMSQPLFVAEPYTKQQGEVLSLSETLDDIRRILDGAADDMDLEALRFIGRLPSTRLAGHG